MQLKNLIAAACLAFAIPAAQAVVVPELGPFKVKSLRPAMNGTVYVQFDPAPANCLGGNSYRMHAGLANTHLNFKPLYSMLLTSYLTGKRFAFIWVEGTFVCSDAGGTIALQLLEFEEAP